MTESFREVKEFTFTHKTDASSQPLPSHLTPACPSGMRHHHQLALLSPPEAAPSPDHSPGNSPSFLQVTAQMSLLHV